MLLDADQQQRHEEVGEDTWELFEAIERSFEVELGDYFALAGIRISELAEKIDSLANYPTREKCLSSVAFYRLRRALQEVCHVPASSIRPSTPIAEILPWKTRRKRWKQLEEAVGLSLPALRGSGWLVLLSYVSPFLLLAKLKISFVSQLSWLAVVLGSLFGMVPMLWLLLPLARALPRGCETVGDLAKLLLSCNYAAFASRDAGSSVSDVQESLILLILLAVGSGTRTILPTTRIPSGLNIY